MTQCKGLGSFLEKRTAGEGNSREDSLLQIDPGDLESLLFKLHGLESRLTSRDYPRDPPCGRQMYTPSDTVELLLNLLVLKH